jgi:hypothetical protein
VPRFGIKILPVAQQLLQRIDFRFVLHNLPVGEVLLEDDGLRPARLRFN